MHLFDLSGRTALITGASKGIGLALATALGQAGARVVLNARSADALTAARDALRAQGIQAEASAFDVTDAAAVDAAVAAIEADIGPIDILVNNAGTSWGAPTVEHSLEAWNKVITLNLSAIFVVTQEVGKRCMLPRRRGKVINIASVQGLSGGYPEGMPTLAYNVSKGGVVNLTRTLANEWAAYDINVNAIAPGYFASKMTKHIFETLQDKTAQIAPLKRTGGPEDLKGLTALLATDAGSFITGQIVAVDGGLTAAF